MLNKFLGMGRLVRDVEVRYSQAAEPLAIAKYTIAINRRFVKEGEPSADFINCVAFGKNAEFAEKYFSKGKQIAIVGRLQLGSYTNKDGVKVYTTDVIVEEQHFAESKRESNTDTKVISLDKAAGFVPIVTDDFEDEMPF